jgi:hypothetical protein
MDVQEYLKNRHEFPHDELSRHTGHYVAWSPDGTRILASDADPARVIEAVKAQGFDPGETVISYVPTDDETLLAGQAGAV